jgi:uncharacterized protein YceK
MRIVVVLFALSCLLAGCGRDSGVQRQGGAEEGKAIRQAGR